MVCIFSILMDSSVETWPWLEIGKVTTFGNKARALHAVVTVGSFYTRSSRLKLLKANAWLKQ